MVRFLLSSVSLALVVGVAGGVIVMPEGAIAQVTQQTQGVEQKKAEGDRLLKEGDRLVQEEKYPEALEVYQKALGLYREMTDRKGEGEVLRGIGNVYRGQKEYGKAIDYQKQALAIARDIKEPDLEAKVLNNIGVIYRDTGNIKEGILYLKEALKIARVHKKYEMEVKSLINLGISDEDSKDYSEALVKYQEALNVERFYLKRPKQETALLTIIVSVYFNLQQYSKTQQPAEESVAVARKSKDTTILLDSLLQLTNTYMLIANRLNRPHIGDSEYQNNPNSPDKQYAHLAIQTAEETKKLASRLKRPDVEATLYLTLGGSYLVMRDSKKAAHLYELAFEAFRQLDGKKSEQFTSLSQVINIKSMIAREYSENQEYHDSIKLFNEAIALIPSSLILAKELQDAEKQKEILKAQSRAYYGIIGVYINLSEFQKAKEFAKISLENAKKEEDIQAQSFALSQLANVYITLGEYENGKEANLQVLDLSKSLSLQELASSLSSVASSYAIFGDHRQAIKFYNQAIKQYEQVDIKEFSLDLRPIYWSGNIFGFSALANSHEQLGEFDLALNSLKQGLELSQTVKVPFAEADVLIRLGKFYLDRNELSLALQSFQAADMIISRLERVKRSYSRRSVKLDILLQITATYTLKGDYSQAWATVRKAQILAHQSSNQKIEREIDVLEKIKNIYSAEGNVAKELETINQIVSASRRLPNAVKRSMALYSMASEYIELGDYNASRDLLQQSLSEAIRSQVPLYQSTPLTQLAKVELFQGDAKQAVSLAEQALDNTQRNGLVYDIDAYHVLAQSYGELGNEAKALEGV